MDLTASSQQTVYQQSVYNGQTNAYVHPDQISSKKQMYCTSRYTAKNIPPSTFQESDALVEFRIDPSPANIDLMQIAWLQVSVRNNDPVNQADVLQSPFLLNRIEVLIGETLVETMYPAQLWVEHLLFEPFQQFEAKSSWMSYNRADGDNVPNNIPVSSATTFIIGLPLPQIAGKLPMSLVRQETQLRCYFNTTAGVQSTVGAQSTSLSLDSANLYISGVKYHSAVKAMVAQALFGKTVACRFYRRNQTRNIVGLTTGSPYTLPITEFNGYSPDVRFIVRNITNPQDMAQGWKNLAKVTNYDENGNPLSLVGQDQGVVEWNMFRNYPDIGHRMRSGTNNKFIHAFAWADDVPGAIKDGLSSGDIKYKSNFSTEIVPLDTGTYEVIVQTYSKSVLSLENGFCSFRIVTSGDDARGMVSA